MESLCKLHLWKSQLKGSHFSHDLNPSWPLINRVNYFRIRFRIRRDIRSQSSKNSTLLCAWHCGVKILVLANQKFFLHIFSFMKDVFTPKRDLLIVPETHKKNDFDSAQCSLQCVSHRRTWLCSRMHTAGLDSSVCCTPQSFLRNFDHLTPWC